MNTKLIKAINNKSIVFISTKNIDYIRNSQEINLLKQHSHSVQVIAFSTKNYLLRVIKVYFALFKVLIKKNYDLLFLGFSPQLLFLLFPLFPSKEKIIMDFFISVYDTLVDDRKKIKRHSFLAKLCHLLDKITIHKANLVIADTWAHGNYFSKEFDFPIEKIEILYIEADTSIYKNNILVNSPLEKKTFNVIYFGSILPVQGIEVILDAVKLLKDHASIKFTIIGPIVKRYRLDPKDFPNTTFIEWLTQEELAGQIAKSDLALAGHFSNTVGKANRTIAGKTYIYKEMGKPVILGDSAANRELFSEDNQTNYYVERGNSVALTQKINEIYMQTKFK